MGFCNSTWAVIRVYDSVLYLGFMDLQRPLVQIQTAISFWLQLQLISIFCQPLGRLSGGR